MRNREERKDSHRQLENEWSRHAVEPELMTDSQVAESRGCPADTVVWARTEGAELCASRCDSDLDCAADERCRVLWDGMTATDPVVLADVVTAEAAELAAANAADGVVEDVSDAAEPTSERRLCDPLWDIEGVASAEVDAE